MQDIINTYDSLDSEYLQAKKREVRREELVQSGQKVTERALDGYVKTVPEVITQQTTVLECQHRYNLSKNILNSLDHQKDMLVQMSANKRAEAKLVSDLG